MDNNDKITVSLDEVNSTRVDAELHRQDVANRMAEHQEKIRVNFSGSGEMISSKGGFFRKAIVYMAIFGFVFSTIGWGLGEIVQKIEDNNPRRQALQFDQARQMVLFFLEKNPRITKQEMKELLILAKEKVPELADNEFLPDKILKMDKDDIDELMEDTKKEFKKLDVIWFIIMGTLVSLGLSIAEGVVSRNINSVLINGSLGAVLGALGGFVVSLFINELYNALQGETKGFCLQQVFARAVGWGILGLFLSIAPGIVMRSWKKFLLGLAGGLIGGLLGGCLFDPICQVFENAIFARFINIIGLGIGAAVAMVILENVAKQGWLKVAAGLIAGKQFILYRNPTVIGSSPKSEIYLFKDPSVAPKHAAINNRNGDFIITAIGGESVLVNNQPVRQHKLKTGDQIRIGQTIFIFEAKAIKKE